MANKSDAVWNLLLGDASDTERRAFYRVAWRLMVIAAILAGWGAFTPILPGFAKADEVDDKIQSSVEPIRAQLGAITTQLATQDDVLKSIRIDQLATKLRELKRTCCLAGSDAEIRARMEQEIERAQQEYRTLANERYPLPPCGGP